MLCKNIFFILAAILLTLTACHKEAALQPSSSNRLYTLPQGNHPYDQDIQQFYDTYHTVMLYKFDSMDYQYNITGPLNVYLYIKPADTSYIPAALDFIHTNWLDLYPSAFLQKTLPFKILLASSIGIGVPYLSQIVAYNYQSTYAGMNWVGFGIVNDSLQKLTPGQIDTTRGALNKSFWQQAIQNQMIETPDSFSTLTTYSKLTSSNLKQYGCFYDHNPNNNAANDLLDYIQVITSTDSVTFKNKWLTPSFDTKGMYAIKYNLIKNYYRTKYGVELQTIGNK
jgi:hypothetical protein